MPVTAFRVMKRGDQWASEDVWENNDVTMDMSTGVLVGSTLFGFSARNSGQFFAVDAEHRPDAVAIREPRQAENAAVVRAGDVWLALQADAQLSSRAATRSSSRS